MQNIYDYILNIMQHCENPLLYNIAAWTVGQFAEWIFNNLSSESTDALIQLLLERMTHAHYKVQLSTASCLSMLIEQGEEQMMRYYDAIIRLIGECMKHYCVGTNCLLFFNDYGVMNRKEINVFFFV